MVCACFLSLIYILFICISLILRLRFLFYRCGNKFAHFGGAYFFQPFGV